MNHLVLASSSPRRRQILEQAGYLFSTSSVKVSEIPRENLNLTEQIEDIATRKALALLHSSKSLKKQGNIILGSDTVVVIDGEILGKPENYDQSLVYLKRLSGRSHQVISAVSLVEAVSERVSPFHDISELHFHDLKEEDTEEYASSGEGLDKAGGYGIQGEARKFVRQFEGSFLNIVGLPLEKLEEVFKEKNWCFEKRKD